MLAQRGPHPLDRLYISEKYSFGFDLKCVGAFGRQVIPWRVLLHRIQCSLPCNAPVYPLSGQALREYQTGENVQVVYVNFLFLKSHTRKAIISRYRMVAFPDSTRSPRHFQILHDEVTPFSEKPLSYLLPVVVQ